MAFADEVLRVLRGTGMPLDDDVIAAELRVIRQQVNQTCRRLQAEGVLRRVPGPDGKIVNLLNTNPEVSPTGTGTSRSRATRAVETPRVSEDEVKAAIKQHLEAQGFTVRVAWGHERGVDVEARRADERWLIEAKGGAPPGPQQMNYFLGALGELVQRMDDDNARYALALPDDPQFRGLASRLPGVARRRLDLTIFFVSRNDGGFAVDIQLP